MLVFVKSENLFVYKTFIIGSRRLKLVSLINRVEIHHKLHFGRVRAVNIFGRFQNKNKTFLKLNKQKLVKQQSSFYHPNNDFS